MTITVPPIHGVEMIKPTGTLVSDDKIDIHAIHIVHQYSSSFNENLNITMPRGIECYMQRLIDITKLKHTYNPVAQMNNCNTGY
jgi:hypothetical protein